MYHLRLAVFSAAALVTEVWSLSCYKDENRIVAAAECKTTEICARHPFDKGTSYTYGCKPKSWCKALRLMGDNQCKSPTTAKSVYNYDKTTSEYYKLVEPWYEHLTACCCDEISMCNLRAMDTAAQEGTRGHFSNLMREDAYNQRMALVAKAQSSSWRAVISLPLILATSITFLIPSLL